MRLFIRNIMFGSIILASCLHAPMINELSTRAKARSAVYTMAVALHEVDEVCASWAESMGGTRGLDLASRCAAGVNIARKSLIQADDALEKGLGEADVGCAAKNAATAMSNISKTLDDNGIPVPKELSDALEVSMWVSALCNKI